MKIMKYYKEIASALMVITCIGASGSPKGLNFLTENAASGIRSSAPVQNYDLGITEFSYYNPEDGKFWHVVNRYFPIGSENLPGYNISDFTIKRDSVLAENNFAGLPESENQELLAAGLNKKDQ